MTDARIQACRVLKFAVSKELVAKQLEYAILRVPAPHLTVACELICQRASLANEPTRDFTDVRHANEQTRNDTGMRESRNEQTVYRRENARISQQADGYRRENA